MMSDSSKKSSAYKEGWAAWFDCVDESNNPYDPSTDECLDWNDGFNAALESEDSENAQ